MMATLRATLEFFIEYEEDEIFGDPAENLLEVLAMQSDQDLYECITITTVDE